MGSELGPIRHDDAQSKVRTIFLMDSAVLPKRIRNFDGRGIAAARPHKPAAKLSRGRYLFRIDRDPDFRLGWVQPAVADMDFSDTVAHAGYTINIASP